MEGFRALQFAREVRRELRAIVWPSRKEVVAVTLLVVALTIVMAVFFIVVDELASRAIQFILT